jgi:signal peptidase II
MKTNKVVRAAIVIAIVMLNVGCDQISKSIVRSHVEAYSSLRFLHDHFMLTRVENTGAFLSLGDQIPGFLHNVLLSIIPAAFLVLGIWYLIRITTLSNLTLVGICFMIGGGAGNVFDRIIHGSVTDFLYLDFPPLHTGVFNMADLSITTGVIIILIDMVRQRRKTPPNLSEGKESKSQS